MKNGRLILVLFVVSMPLLTGCQRKAVDEVGLGSLEGSVYTNKYFGLTVTLPAGWSNQDQKSLRELTDLGGQVVAGDDKNLKAIVKTAETTTVNLFGSFRHPMGAPVPFNPSVMCLAERTRHLPGIKKGRDYLYHLKKLIESSQMKISFAEEISTETLGGQDFDVLQTEMSTVGVTVYQKYFVTVLKGYALMFVVSYTTDEEGAELQEVLKSISFG